MTAIAEQNWQQVAARKGRLAAQWEQVATKAVDQLNDHLDASTLSPNALVPIAGVATDKLLALSGDGPTPFRDLHIHGLADDDIVAFAVHPSKKKPVKAEVIDEAPKALPHT